MNSTYANQAKARTCPNGERRTCCRKKKPKMKRKRKRKKLKRRKRTRKRPKKIKRRVYSIKFRFDSMSQHRALVVTDEAADVVVHAGLAQDHKLVMLQCRLLLMRQRVHPLRQLNKLKTEIVVQDKVAIKDAVVRQEDKRKKLQELKMKKIFHHWEKPKLIITN